MPKGIVYKTKHRVRFAQLDPYQHMATEHYAGMFMDHRFTGLRENVGWDMKGLNALPFAIWIKRMEIDFQRPVIGDQELTITSFVKEFRGPEAHMECTMVDEAGKTASKCSMIAYCIEKKTMRPMDWPADIMAMFFEKETA